jgi:hypothetical protein
MQLISRALPGFRHRVSHHAIAAATAADATHHTDTAIVGNTASDCTNAIPAANDRDASTATFGSIDTSAW